MTGYLNNPRFVCVSPGILGLEGKHGEACIFLETLRSYDLAQQLPPEIGLYEDDPYGDWSAVMFRPDQQPAVILGAPG